MKIRSSMLLIAAVMAVIAVPALAQLEPRVISREPAEWSDETTYTQGQYLDNPCTAVQDWVWVDYEANASARQRLTSVARYLFSENTSMSGMYAASGSSEADVAYGATFAVRKYHKVNTPDNFHVVTVINFDPEARYMWVTMEKACGNGMPDSVE